MFIDGLRELVVGTDNFRSETFFFTIEGGVGKFGFRLLRFSVGFILNLLRDVVELVNDLFEYESVFEYNKLFFILVRFSFISIDKSVWIDFVELFIGGWSFSLNIDSAILSLSDSSSSSSSIVPSSLIVIEGRDRIMKGSCSCWSWCKINETLSVKSASIVSGA